MSLQITLPFGNKTNIKNLVFSILIYNHPLKIVELMNIIHRRYGRDVTFQAVRGAVLELLDERVVLKKEKEFEINKEWVKDSLNILKNIDSSLHNQNPKKIDSINGEISVIEFDSLSELMKYSEQLIDDWFKRFKNGDYKINCYQGAHYWEALLYPEQERKIIGQLKKKGIRSYSLITSNTPLDRNIAKFYRTSGLRVVNYYSNSKSDRAYYVATYGDLIAETRYPAALVDELDRFFKKNKKLEDLDLHELAKIADKKIKIKITIIRNLEMAKQINSSIISKME